MDVRRQVRGRRDVRRVPVYVASPLMNRMEEQGAMFERLLIYLGLRPAPERAEISCIS